MPTFLFRLLACMVLLMVLGSGCSTTTSQEESDLPWATPENWEAAPYIPGFDGNQ